MCQLLTKELFNFGVPRFSKLFLCKERTAGGLDANDSLDLLGFVFLVGATTMGLTGAAEITHN